MFTDKDIDAACGWAYSTAEKWFWQGVKRGIKLIRDNRETIREAVGDVKLAVDFLHKRL